MTEYLRKPSVLDQFKLSKETIERHAQYTYEYDSDSDSESEVESEEEEEYDYECIEDINERTFIKDVISDVDYFKNYCLSAQDLIYKISYSLEKYNESQEIANSVAEVKTTERLPEKDPPSNTQIALVTIGAVALLCFIFK